MTVTNERLHELFNLDPDVGVFIRRIPTGRHDRYKAGQVAGCLNHGYVIVGVDSTAYRAHRLVWLWVHGHMPVDQLDHINGDRSDNRIRNLREATNALNSQNERRPRSNNKTGLIGVSQEGVRFRADIKLNGRTFPLGRFTAPESAHAAYLAAKARLHPFSTIGNGIVA